MGAEAGVDEGVLHRLGIEDRQLPARVVEREQLCRRMVRFRRAPIRIGPAADARGVPQAAALVEHGVVIVRLGVPELPVAPIGRRRRRLDGGGVAGPERQRRVRIAHRHLEERYRVRLGIEDRHIVGRVFRRAVKLAVGVDRGIAPVRRDQVVQVLVRRGPGPRGDHEVALDAARTLGLGERQFALGDAVGPVAEIFVRHAAELTGDAVGHLLARLARQDAALPRFGARIELAELRRDRARRLLAELMTADAIDVFHPRDPSGARDVLRDIGRAAEVALRRDRQHRVPVNRGIIMRGCSIVRRRHGGVIENLARLRAQLG